MGFNSDFSSGDCGNFDMRISNKVFNELRQHSFSMAKKSNQHLDRQENAKTSEMGMDQKTRLLLYKLINTSMILESVDGIISKGKEAVVLHGEGNVHNENMEIPKEVAVKIFSTTLNEFKQRDKYIKDDHRFKGHVKQNNKNIFQLWTEKEFHNLHRLQKANILCPKPIIFKKHVLVMSFIGNGYNNPARKLKDSILTEGELIVAYDNVVEIMKKMYQSARLIHADFSEYNLLYHEGEIIVIDLAQAVEPCHPAAFEFLMRDCSVITSFFERNRVPVKTKEELFFEITKLDPITTNVSMLEKIHMKGDAAHVVTTPHHLDEELINKLPEKHRLKEFPFDYAWKKVEEFKSKNEKQEDDNNEGSDDSWVEVVSSKRKSSKVKG
jgi:RIO kinase 3